MALYSRYLRYLKLYTDKVKTTFLMETSDKDRINKLESRAREAENSLQQLRAYVELLKKKSTEASSSAETRKLEEENALLKKELLRIKQELIMAELKNGVVQYAMPSEIIPQTSSTGPAKPVPASSSSQASGPPPSTLESVETKQSQPKESKSGKKDKAKKNEGKGGGGGGAKGGDKPVDVSRLDMRIGKILKAWKHPDADGLYVEEVDVGEPGKTRTVCSGLVDHVSLDQMQERLAIFLCNLKPAKMRGISSEAMVMCASTPEKVEILDPPSDCVVGERVICAGYEGEPDAQLNPKKKVFENVQPDLRTSDEGVACYKGVPFTIPGKGVCRSQTMKGTGIK